MGFRAFMASFALGMKFKLLPMSSGPALPPRVLSALLPSPNPPVTLAFFQICPEKMTLLIFPLPLSFTITGFVPEMGSRSRKRKPGQCPHARNQPVLCQGLASCAFCIPSAHKGTRENQCCSSEAATARGRVVGSTLAKCVHRSGFKQPVEM